MKDLSTFTNEDTFAAAQRMAKALSASNLVPKEFQNNLPNTLIALEYAGQMGASPLAIMQSMYVIHGKPSFSSQFVIAAINSCGRFTQLRYEMGDDNQSCYAYALDVDSDEVLKGPLVSIEMAKAEGWYGKNGSKWQTIPELMLRYRAATFFGRLYAPDVLMGMQSSDEVRDVGGIDVTPKKTTLDSLKAESPRSESSHVTPGPPVDSNGEIWNQEIHATGRDEMPVFNQDGSFRARRFTQKHKEDESPVGEPEASEAAPDAESALSFAGIAEMIHMAESSSDIAAAMVFIVNLPEDQQIELNSLAHDKSKGFT